MRFYLIVLVFTIYSNMAMENHVDQINSGIAVEETNVTHPSIASSNTRRSSKSTDRNNKLMSVLAARRHALLKDRTNGNHTNRNPTLQREECEKNCTNNFTTRLSAGCSRRCAVLFRKEPLKSSNQSQHLNSRQKVDMNSIGEELLDTEESQSTGIYIIKDGTQYSPNSRFTKDFNRTNFRNSIKNNVIDSEDRIKSAETIYVPHNHLYRNQFRNISQYRKYDPMNKTHVLTVSQMNFENETDLKPPHIRQKLILNHHKNDSMERHDTSANGTEIRTTLSPIFNRSKINRETAFKRISINRKLINRNQPNIVKSYTSAILLNTTGNSTFSKPEVNMNLEHTKMNIPLPNVNEFKVILTRSANNSEKNSSLSELISDIVDINGTDNDIILTRNTVRDTSSNISYNSTIIVQSLNSTPPNIIITPSSNLFDSTTVFPNVTELTVSTAISISTEQPLLSKVSNNSVNIVNTTLPITFPEINSISPNYNSSKEHTGSTVIPQFSSSKTTDSTVILEVSTITSSSITYITSILTGTSTESPSTGQSLVDWTAVLSPTVDMISTNKTSTTSSILLQRNGDVTIEMHKMNMATYVLAGLGMFPVLIIILYIIKSILFRKNDFKIDNNLTTEEGKYKTNQLITPIMKTDVQNIEKNQEDQNHNGEDSITVHDGFNRNKLQFKSLLGEGNFGQVWKAEADDLPGHLGATRIVAVKTERSENGGLRNEAEIMKKLGSHSNVVTILGACLDKEPQLLIMEFAMRGRLLSLLRAVRGTVGINTSINIVNTRWTTQLSPRKLAGFAHDIAKGMEYIASKKIVHRDLAARNVLLDHHSVCKICDFGMSIDLEKSKTHNRKLLRQQSAPPESGRSKFDFHSRFIGGIDRSQSQFCKRPALPIRWMAPEALQYHVFNTETDVWAFGIVLWEIATLGCTPYPSLSGREVVRSVPNGTRPEIPTDCRPELYNLMMRVWNKEPTERPSFTDARMEIAQCLCQWEIDDTISDSLDVSGFSEDLDHGKIYFNRRISEFECDI